MQPLYLSWLKLRALSREAQRDLANCDSMHRRLLMAFPDDPGITQAREQFGALYRIETTRDGTDILVQSQALPDWSRLPAGYLREPVAAAKQLDPLYSAIESGQTLVFRLRANPTRRISNRSQTSPEQWRGKRVELRTPQEQLDWLKRKGEASGFALLATRVAPDSVVVPDVRTTRTADHVTGRRAERRLTFASVVFEGRLRVTDAETLRAALAAGIGSGKAFGFGLLSVAPAPSATSMSRG